MKGEGLNEDSYSWNKKVYEYENLLETELSGTSHLSMAGVKQWEMSGRAAFWNLSIREMSGANNLDMK
jgi:hypothetical protein